MAQPGSLDDFALEQTLRERAAEDFDAELAIERLDGRVRVAFRHYTDPMAEMTGGVTDVTSAQGKNRRVALLASPEKP